jgi:hypothetical protein
VSEEKLPSWQANNFSDFNFFCGFSKMAGKLWIGRSIECVEIFQIFFNGICETEKVRDLGRALPGSCGNFREN